MLKFLYYLFCYLQSWSKGIIVLWKELKAMNISEVAKKYDLSPSTLRYYEEEGLMPRVNRSANGNRDFNEEDLNWVYFVKCMRNSGVSISSLSEYSGLFQQGEGTLLERKEILIREYDKLLKRQKEINETVERMEKKLANYDKQLKECKVEMTLSEE